MSLCLVMMMMIMITCSDDVFLVVDRRSVIYPHQFFQVHYPFSFLISLDLKMAANFDCGIDPRGEYDGVRSCSVRINLVHSGKLADLVPISQYLSNTSLSSAVN